MEDDHEMAVEEEEPEFMGEEEAAVELPEPPIVEMEHAPTAAAAGASSSVRQLFDRSTHQRVAPSPSKRMRMAAPDQPTTAVAAAASGSEAVPDQPTTAVAAAAAEEEPAAEEAAGDFDAVTPLPTGAVQLKRGKWNDLPSDKLMEKVAYDNCGNWTGFLKWFENGTKLTQQLLAITCGFCDNIVVKRFCAPEQVKIAPDKDKRSQVYVRFASDCRVLREICAANGLEINPKDVTGARIYAVAERDEDSTAARTLTQEEIANPAYVPEQMSAWKPWQPSEGYWQCYKIALPDCDLQQVLDLVHSGAFAEQGLFLNDFDVTIDCNGVVDCQQLKKYLLAHWDLGFVMEGNDVDKEKEKYMLENGISKRVILDNAHKVSNNCLSWMQTNGTGLRMRVKVYVKLIQEFEKASVRRSDGQHIGDWQEMHGTRLADARDTTEDDGLMRSETSVYVDGHDIPITKAHKFIPRTAAEMTKLCEIQLDVVPKELVLSVSHHEMVAAWCKNVKHTLVVVDLFYDRAFIAYAKNEVTHTTAGIMVSRWKRHWKYALQRNVLGVAPVDLIYLQRGSEHVPVKQQFPEETANDKKMGKDKQKKVAKAMVRKSLDELINNWIDADADSHSQTSIMQFLSHGKRPRDGDAGAGPSNEGPGDGDEPEEEEEAEEEEEEAEEVQMDQEALLALELAKREAEHAKELEEARASACVDNTTAPDDSLPSVDCPEGSLTYWGVRHHRISVNPSEECVTYFPPNGALGHFFALPEGHDDYPTLTQLVANPTTAAQKQKKKDDAAANCAAIENANRVYVTQLVKQSGWAPPVNEIIVKPLVAKPTVSNRLHSAYIVDTVSMLDVDMQTIKSCTRRCSMVLSRVTLKKRKTSLMLRRQAARVISMAEGAAERPGLVELKHRTSAACAAKQALKASGVGKSLGTLRSLANGAYSVVAIRFPLVREGEDKKKVASDHGFVLYLTVQGSTRPFFMPGHVIDGLKQHEISLAPLFNALGDREGDRVRYGTFYMGLDNGLSHIGTLTLASSVEKAANGRDKINCGLSIVLPDDSTVAVAETVEAQREAHVAAAPDAPVAPVAPGVAAGSGSVSAGPLKPLPLLVTEGTKRSTKAFEKVFPLQPNSQPRVFQVLKVATVKHNGHDRVLLELREDVPGAGVQVVWGGATMLPRVGDLTRDCSIVLIGHQKRGALFTLSPAGVVPLDARVNPKKPVATLTKGGAQGQPASVTVRQVGSMEVQRKVQTVVLGTDGILWGFADYKNAPALAVGDTLDTVNMTVVSGGGAGSSA